MVYPAKEHVRKTFQALLNLLPETERTKPQAILLAGEVTPFRNDTDREMVFRQESNFYYLSGCTVPSSLLFIAYQAGTSLDSAPTIELFIPPISLADLMWSVPPPTVQVAQESHQVTRVAHPSDLPGVISTFAKAFPEALFHVLPRKSPHFPHLDEKLTDLVLSLENGGNGAVSDLYLLRAIHTARLIKTPYEIAQIERANQISSRAHETVMRVLGLAVKNKIAQTPEGRPPLPGEWLIEKEAEAEAIFVASCRREGAVHQAYLPIVAASNRASTLHYCCNDREFAWGPHKPHSEENKEEFARGTKKEIHPQVLLIDAGCEWDCYASDITRTMPVGNNGRFAPEAREIYTLVHEMQKAAFDLIRPGVHWDAVHLICHRVLVRGFQKLGIFKSPNSPGGGSWCSEEAILASGITSAFFPHGLGHSLGMDVHDVPFISKPDPLPDNHPVLLGHESFYTYLRLRLPLQVGMVVTVEPGCYFSPHLLAPVREDRVIDREVLKRYEGVGGVRIEDVIVIEPEGFRNLTSVRSDVEWVEGVCSGEL